jgi:hypothetical protein
MANENDDFRGTVAILTEFRVFAKKLGNGDLRLFFSGLFLSLPQSAFTQAFVHTRCRIFVVKN